MPKSYFDPLAGRLLVKEPAVGDGQDMPKAKSGSVERRRRRGSKQQGRSATILLADDEPSLRQMLTVLLEAAGYSLMVAADGRQALELANAYPGKIDLLLSDVQMPGLTGPDLARELHRSRPDLKIILISGCWSPLVTSENEWRFLHKPFGPYSLLEEVKIVLG